MPVVINEFEVVPDTAPPAQQAGANRGGDADSAKQQEETHMDDILHRWRERAARVRAH